MSSTSAIQTGNADSAGSAADFDLDLLGFLASLTPAERMLRHDSALQLVLALREAAKRHYGFDPRTVATADPRER